MEIFLTIILYAVIAAHATSENDIENLLNESITMINNSQYDEALTHLDKILSIDENNLQALSNKGGLLIKLKKYDEAIENFDKALEIKPDFVEALNNKGIALYNLGKYNAAVITFYKSAEIDPDNKISQINVDEVIKKIPFEWEKGYVKIELRDKENNLVGYTEMYEFVMRKSLANILFEKEEWKNVELDGTPLKKLTSQWEFSFDKTSLHSRSDIFLTIGKIDYRVIQILHNGFLVKEGDHVKMTMELFRNR
jgi:tetratricopeptide (TPR) repeat protein